MNRGRKRLRLSEYDYSGPGVYFITICTHGRRCLFGEIRDVNMRLSKTGLMIQKWWMKLPEKFPFLQIDKSTIMPNHLHGILTLDYDDESIVPCVKSDLPAIVQWFKTMTTNEFIRGVKENRWPQFKGKLWQRSYYDHVIRNEKEFEKIREYIEHNPLKWHLDRENPKSTNFDIDHEAYFANFYG
jgi:REP element-mobilizing transposase RayT